MHTGMHTGMYPHTHTQAYPPPHTHTRKCMRDNTHCIKCLLANVAAESAINGRSVNGSQGFAVICAVNTTTHVRMHMPKRGKVLGKEAKKPVL